MMAWYFYYLIVGFFIATVFYVTSVRYKIKHKDYIRHHPLITWNFIWQKPLAILIWPLFVIGGAYSSMRVYHLKQKLAVYKLEDIT